MYFLSNKLQFPPTSEADSDGLLAIGGDLSVERLLLAYKTGIFPWYNPGEPILWYSPDPRMVLFPEELHVSKSMKQLLKKEAFKVTFNTAFEQVITCCANATRTNQTGTWITSAMKKAYVNFHKLGHALSVEVWLDEKLVGGLYGVWLADLKVFCGESMFTKVSNASKFGFIKLVQWLQTHKVKLIDCQVHTNHLASLGAKEIPRDTFLKYLK